MRSLALVNHTGRVFWPPPTKFRSTCPVDVAFFPFDDQTCILKLGSWLHDGYSVRKCTSFGNIYLSTFGGVLGCHSCDMTLSSSVLLKLTCQNNHPCNFLRSWISSCYIGLYFRGNWRNGSKRLCPSFLLTFLLLALFVKWAPWASTSLIFHRILWIIRP